MEEDLPSGWVWKSLGELGDWAGGGTPSKANKSFWENGTIPWVSPKDMKSERIKTAEDMITQEAVDNSATKVIPENSVLMVTRSGILSHTFPVAVTECEVTVNQDLKCLTPIPSVKADYIAWYLRSQNSRILNDCSKDGTTVASIDTENLKKLTVPLAPEHEQARIVEKIETLFVQLDKGEELLRAVQKLLTRYRQSVLKAAVTGELTADWRAENAHRIEHGRDLLARILKTRRESWSGRGKYKEPVAPDTSDLLDLPEGWVWGSADQLLAHLTSGSRDWKQYYGRGEGVFIMAQNVRPMSFDLSEVFVVDPPADSPDAIRSEVRKDDILITIVGANTGDVCRFPLDRKKHYVCQSVALLRMVDLKVSPFVELFLSGKGAGRDQLEKFIYGAGRPHLSFEQLRSVCIPLPSLEEQALIMDQVDEAFERIRAVERICLSELTGSEGLRRSILKEAFSGHLVEQDPGDEPASELLARIKVEHATTKKTRRGKATA